MRSHARRTDMHRDDSQTKKYNYGHQRRNNFSLCSLTPIGCQYALRAESLSARCSSIRLLFSHSELCSYTWNCHGRARLVHLSPMNLRVCFLYLCACALYSLKVMAANSYDVGFTCARATCACAQVANVAQQAPRADVAHVLRVALGKNMRKRVRPLYVSLYRWARTRSKSLSAR